MDEHPLSAIPDPFAVADGSLKVASNPALDDTAEILVKQLCKECRTPVLGVEFCGLHCYGKFTLREKELAAQVDDPVRKALGVSLEEILGVVALVSADPRRHDLGDVLYRENLPRLVRALAQGRKALKS